MRINEMTILGAKNPSFRAVLLMAPKPRRLLDRPKSVAGRALSEQFVPRPPATTGCPDEEPVPLIQQLAGSDPAGRNDVRQIPAVAEAR